MRTIPLGNPSFDFDDVRAILRGEPVKLKLTPSALRKIRRSRGFVERAITEGQTLYGVNTGFGKLSDTRIEASHIDELQENLILSHSAGLGATLPPRTAALLVALRVHSLALGYSGVSVELVERLAEMFNSSIAPVILEVGSVGASGD